MNRHNLFSRRALICLAALAALFGCQKPPQTTPTPAATSAKPAVELADAPSPTQVAPPAVAGKMTRAQFNQLATETALPLFWIEDRNNDTVLQADELAVLTGVGRDPATRWIRGGKLTPEFEASLAELTALQGKLPAHDAPQPAERRRREAVLAELRQGRPTLLYTDFRQASAQDKALVRHILAAARKIERLHAKQNGVDSMGGQIPADDRPSKALFQRNQGPWCVAPATEKNPDCNALATRPAQLSGIYPSDLQVADPKFCETLGKRPDEKLLMSPFTVVRKAADGKLISVPYRDAFGVDMDAIADELDAAAAVIQSPDEAPFKAYLVAAVRAFRTGDWQPADEAWAKMNATNSKWYLRIAPDETYFEPCSRKAGFHVSFARIDPGSLKWQKILDPLKNDLEQALAKLAGPPYVARKVDFHLPDFIAIVLNAGDARAPLGATVGQSLPNWGPVANEGRGRTVAMTNVGTDPDSRKALEGQASSLFCKATMARFTTEPEPLQMSTVLHEAAHNLGPAHEYKAGGKTDDEWFGGPLAATLEELKAQTAALYFTDWLAQRGTIDEKARDQAHLADIAWGFGHISNGMVDARGKPKPYSQLAAIQVGALLQAGAIVWQADQKAANGQDTGCFEVLAEKTTGAVLQLMTRVAGIKARGDKADAEALRKTFVEDPGTWSGLRDTIRERWLRAPKASYVYSVAID